MGSEEGLKSVKVELPPATQTAHPGKAYRFAHRHRTIAVSVFIGVALWFVHKHHTPFTPESWVKGHPDLLGYDKSGSLTGKEVEELFL